MRLRLLLPALLVPFFVHVAPEPARAQDRAEFAWHCPDFTVLVYERVRAPGDNRWSSETARYVIPRGQIDADGNWHTGYSGKDELGELALRLASIVPGKAPGRTKTWTREFDTAAIVRGRDWLPDRLQVTGTYISTQDGMAKYRIEATGEDLEAAAPSKDPHADPDKQIRLTTADLECEFDAAKGWLRRVEGKLLCPGTGITPPPGMQAPARDISFALSEHTTLADRAAFEAEVKAAIAAGLRRIDATKHEWDKRPGHAALAAYTMLQCGRKATDAEVMHALDCMVPPEGKTQFVQQYHAAAQILAIEAKYIGDEERRQVIAGQSPSEFRRALSQVDRAQVEAALDYLVRSQVTGQNGVWSYGVGIGTAQVPDLSNGQFAVMAMAAATRCGVALPVGLVRATGESLLTFQQAQGPALKRALSRDRKGNWVRAKEAVPCRGFTYYQQGATAGATYGSITGAGVCCALLLLDMHEGMDDERKRAEFTGTKPKEWREALTATAESGLAWLERNWTVAANPHYAHLTPTHYCCYLYSLERVGALAQTQVIGPHEWYTEGAMTLLQRQNKEGGWGQFEDTSFALLFLSRATTPTRSSPITGR